MIQITNNLLEMMPEEIIINIVIYLGPEYKKMIEICEEFKCLINKYEIYITRHITTKYGEFINFYKESLFSYKYAHYNSLHICCERSNILTKICFYLYRGWVEFIKEEEWRILLNPTNHDYLNKIIERICSKNATLCKQT